MNHNNKFGYHIILLCLISVMFWVTYTYSSITNYTQGVAEDLRNDLEVYFTNNERLADQLIDSYPSFDDDVSDHHTSLDFSSLHNIYGLNIVPTQFSEFVGTFITFERSTFQHSTELKRLLHLLDYLWAQDDNYSPEAFYSGYNQPEPYIYNKLRYSLTTTPPKSSPERYRQNMYPQNIRTSFITRPFIHYPSIERNISLITPIFIEDELIGDLGLELNLNDVIQSSLGPWMSKYIVADIEYESISYRSKGSVFLPSLLSTSQTFRNVRVTAYIKMSYIMKYVLPWACVVMLQLMLTFAIIIKNSEFSRYLSELTHTDELTGLYNKRVINELESWGYTEGTLFYIDVNQFKGINDQLGHNVGDMALKFIANRLSYNSQEGVCIRLGGDEFLIVIPTLLKNPTELAKKLRTEVSKEPFYKDVYLDIAIGFKHYHSPEEFLWALDKADANMYSNKYQNKLYN